VIRGCVPKKFFVYASDFGQAFEDAKGFGWTVENAKFDWPTLRDRVAADVERLSRIYESGMTKAGATMFAQRAEIVDAHTVRLVKSGRTISAERILVSTGGQPERLTIPGAEHALVSDDMFNLPALPKRAVIVGGGYIACEFAHILEGLGVDVTMIYRGERILRGFDDDVRAHVQAEYQRTGVKIICGANLEAIQKTAIGYHVPLSNGESIDTDLVLLAVGRRPHTKGLGLESAGVKLKDNGAIIVDDFTRTNVPSIMAVGDVTDRINLTPVAIREAMGFVETFVHGRPTQFDHADVPCAVFGRPPVGVVGLNEGHARELFSGGVDIYKTSFRPMKHVLAENHQRMLMKLVVRRDNQAVVGVHIVGPDAPEMVQLAAIAVKAGLTKAQWDATCALHPTAAEELVTLREKMQDPVVGGVKISH
jgi:glutathione reductase (NADPH)